jgi:hypothetical protein
MPFSPASPQTPSQQQCPGLHERRRRAENGLAVRALWRRCPGATPQTTPQTLGRDGEGSGTTEVSPGHHLKFPTTIALMTAAARRQSAPTARALKKSESPEDA